MRHATDLSEVEEDPQNWCPEHPPLCKAHLCYSCAVRIRIQIGVDEAADGRHRYPGQEPGRTDHHKKNFHEGFTMDFNCNDMHVNAVGIRGIKEVGITH
jgi:hypothetical protein